MTRHKSLTLSGMLLVLFFSGCSGPQSGLEPARRELVTGYTGAFALVSPDEAAETRLPELSESSGLSDYLAYAALNNPGLEAAFYRWKAALEEVPQVKALPDPRFNYRYFIQEVETRVGPQRQSFGISQVFPWFGKLDLRGDVAAAAASAAQKRYESAKLKLFFEVKDAYYEYYYLAKSIAVTKDHMSLMEHLEGVARSRYKVAAASHPDVIRAQVELGKLEDRYLSLVDLKQPTVARLNAALNRPVEAPIPAPAQIPLEQVEVADAKLLARLVQANPQLQALDFMIAQQQRSIELAKKDYYPDVMLGVSVIDTSDSIVGSPKDNGKDPVVASISVNLPIWGKKYSAGVRQARARYNAARRDRTEMANSLGWQLKTALYRFRDGERKINLYRDTLLPKAEESLKVTEAGFRAAKGTFTDLVDAQRTLLEFGLSLERAFADRSQALAKLEMLVGSRIKPAGNKNSRPDVNNSSGEGTRKAE